VVVVVGTEVVQGTTKNHKTWVVVVVALATLTQVVLLTDLLLTALVLLQADRKIQIVKEQALVDLKVAKAQMEK
jgi:hypothetical protein